MGGELRIKTRTEITVETARVVVISGRRLSARAECEQCDSPVTMLTLDEAARLARVSTRTIYKWVEADRLHFTETTDGLLLVCLNSIPSAGSL